jgi:predicted membrane chloride channel (bestrophin family)
MPIQYITPLWHWSESNREAAELAIEIGKAYATAMNGMQPDEATIAALKQHVRRLASNLGKAERMEAGPLPDATDKPE